MAEDNLPNFQFDDVKLTDYIDESLIKLLNRDNASRISFRCTGGFPSPVTEDLIGMTCYRVDLKAEYKLVSVTPDPVWQMTVNLAGSPTTKEEVAANYQKKNASLTSLSGLSNSKDTLPYFSAKDTMSLTDFTNFARSLIAKATKEEVRSLLGLGRAALLDVPIDGSYIKDGTLTLNQLDISSLGMFLPQTGDCWPTYATSAPTGWVMADDGTIGSSSSGATNASDETKDLFYLLWNLPVTPIYSATGVLRDKGSTADIDWYANARLGLPKLLGRVLGVAGNGEGLTIRTTGSSTGTETQKLSVEQLPKHTHGDLDSYYGVIGAKDGVYNCKMLGSKKYSTTGFAFSRWANEDYYAGKADTSSGEGTAVSIMQPTAFLNFKIKL